TDWTRVRLRQWPVGLRRSSRRYVPTSLVRDASNTDARPIRSVQSSRPPCPRIHDTHPNPPGVGQPRPARVGIAPARPPTQCRDTCVRSSRTAMLVKADRGTTGSVRVKWHNRAIQVEWPWSFPSGTPRLQRAECRLPHPRRAIGLARGECPPEKKG